jgi:endonuclease YncB( thermonuclease family)
MPQKASKGTKKLLRHLAPFVFLCAFLCPPAVKAASLVGKVIEVNSGDVITIFNLNRPVRVRLLGVDAPEMDQAFGDVAKKHLADLVLDKSVLVEYAGIAGDHSLNGRVLLEGADIGAQMIRDGAAWVDPDSEHRLSVTDREVYQQSEVAARSERRGLWQQENPVAPWEFAKAVAMRRNPVATPTPVGPAKQIGPKPAAELTNLTLIASRMGGSATSPGRSFHASELPGFLEPVEGGNWRELRPPRENFSALVPEAGETKTVKIPSTDGITDVHLYRGRDGRSAFVLAWLKGKTLGESDVVAMKQNAVGFVDAWANTFKNLDAGPQPLLTCELENERDISMQGYSGLEFDLSSCMIPTKVRVFTRVINGERQMYIGSVFYVEPNDNVDRFINSFIVTPPASTQKGTKGAKTR